MNSKEMAKIMDEYHITDAEAAKATGIGERNIRYMRDGEKHIPKNVEEKLLNYINTLKAERTE